ncbi:MAG: (2Fe-2S)-binding protein [Oligoflexia bacterium]|nr:(2Fe-2S)-binding protein [Oligoflexia bacterium]
MSGTNGTQTELVTLTIDGKVVRAAKGSTIIQAATAAGIEVPFYCYHPHLSIPANCRICQVKVKNAPKLMVACHTQVAEGMEVNTHHTSPEVQAAQAATLEFILINHPLDCTVCDQAGHCKLQDYHFEYNAKPSRFIENKVHKVKAEPLGPTVMLDGERCIMCTRCIRFCDEITETSEIGMLNRGDRSVITVNPKKPLDNALSGTVVDLCPVGALTHAKWRFNTRIWFTKQTDSICPGCSTGCNVKVAERDGEIVQVKARLNDKVNKEWLCDEGRYGFMRFLPKHRIVTPHIGGKAAELNAALLEASKLKGQAALVLVSPDLTLEEFSVLKNLVDKTLKGAQVALAYRERPLSKVEKILVSPDYAANFRGAEFAGLVSGNLEESYAAALQKLRSGAVQQLLLVGERSIPLPDQDPALIEGIKKAAVSVGILTDAGSAVAGALKVVLPGRSILEKSGLLVNRNLRLQYTDRVVPFPDGSEPEWRMLGRLAEKMGAKLTSAEDERALTLSYLSATKQLSGVTIRQIKADGVCLKSLNAATSTAGSQTGAAQWS